LTVITDSSTEMVGYAFVVIKSGSPAKCSGQFSASSLVRHTYPQCLHWTNEKDSIPIQQESQVRASLSQLHLRAT
jgi:hypothetical protein